eukprot:gene20529-24605_t
MSPLMKWIVVVLTAVSMHSTVALKRSVISTPDAPKAIGPYSQGIVVEFASGEKTIHAAGQIGLDPHTGELVTGGVTNETARAMANIKAIMTAGGATMSDIVECTCLLADLQEYSAFNAVYAKSFPTD